MSEYIDLDRLEELRDRHRRTLAEYRRASADVSEAVKSLSRLRVSALPLAPDVTSPPAGSSPWPVPATCATRAGTGGVVQPAPVPHKITQQIKAAEARLARLTTALEALRHAVKQSTAFMTRLEQFARARNL